MTRLGVDSLVPDQEVILPEDPLGEADQTTGDRPDQVLVNPGNPAKNWARKPRNFATIPTSLILSGSDIRDLVEGELESSRRQIVGDLEGSGSVAFEEPVDDLGLQLRIDIAREATSTDTRIVPIFDEG